ncbi:MAG TPA: Ni/Fe hydrogenase subunit alpha [Polyangia bacterium]|jgi:F420-non-reducing hydrogenase large subunit
MTRTIEINPVTRIEGHATVNIEVGDDGRVAGACMHVLEFRGFERFVKGMQVELMPTLTTRICGTCPHAHHLVGAKTVDKVFGVTPPRAAVLLRELLNCGSMIHSHAIHFFALAGPDLLLGLNAPPAQRNLLGLLDAAPELATKALRLRTLGQRICEIVGGRGTHPVTAVAGGMSAALKSDSCATLRGIATEAVGLAQVAVAAGKAALGKHEDLLTILPLEVHSLGTVRDGRLDLYDGTLRVCRPDGSVAADFPVEEHRQRFFEEAVPYSYAKQLRLRDGAGAGVPYRVGPLARLNCAERIDTPLAAAELEEFRSRFGRPCHLTVLNHHARLIELLHCAEKAVALLADDEIASPNVRAPITATPRPAAAHIEAPRGVLIHDYDVDPNGIMRGANLIVATQHNMSSINASIKDMAQLALEKPDADLLNHIEFAIRCYDPCLSCSTHQVGSMPLAIAVTRGGRPVRTVRR